MAMKDIGRKSGIAYQHMEQKKWYPTICLPLDKFPKLGNIRNEAMLLVKVKTKGVTAHDGGEDTIELEILKAEITPEKSVNQSLDSLRGGYR